MWLCFRDTEQPRKHPEILVPVLLSHLLPWSDFLWDLCVTPTAPSYSEFMVSSPLRDERSLRTWTKSEVTAAREAAHPSGSPELFLRTPWGQPYPVSPGNVCVPDSLRSGVHVQCEPGVLLCVPESLPRGYVFQGSMEEELRSRSLNGSQGEALSQEAAALQRALCCPGERCS